MIPWPDLCLVLLTLAVAFIGWLICYETEDLD